MTRRNRNRRVRTAAERQRDRRARQRRGDGLFPLVLPDEAIRDYLVENGYLKEWDEDDFERVREALEVHIRERVTRDGS
ncbi:hypothetical protein [Brucella lupini]|uniref:Uncharacterized protein n=1 Tax=Brucella lupini TaxID=255457 RepID=A0AB34DSW8_9HYPH|nr:hypothetical protein [Brucella lupini]KAB2706486.1 hypothetical protein F9L03_02110 [Brucella lupini]